MTRITINLPLVDARACTGCPCLRERWTEKDACAAFPSRLGPKVLKWARVDGRWVNKRLPECLAAEVEEVERG